MPHTARIEVRAAQWDDDESVAEAAVAALNRIQPSPEVATRVVDRPIR